MYKTLIVDDDPGILDVLCTWFSQHGHEVTYALTGDSAIQLIPKIDPDLLIADIKMKPVDGIQVLKTAKLHNPLMAVIMITGHLTQLEDAVEAMKLGADDYICKPFELDQLQKRVEYALKFQEKLKQRWGWPASNGARLVQLSQMLDSGSTSQAWAGHN